MSKLNAEIEISDLLSAFAIGVTEKIGYYVYLLIDPRNGAIF